MAEMDRKAEMVGFMERLMASEARPEVLSPFELRVIAIMKSVLVKGVVLANLRKPGVGAEVTPPVVTVEIAVEGARLALAMAVEVEGSLRAVRDRLERIAG